MTTRAPRPLPERVQVLEIAHKRHEREVARIADDAKRSAQQSEFAVEDVRTLSDLARRLEERADKTDARLLVLHSQQGEQLSVMRQMADALDRLEPTVESARTKASGAHRLALSHEARLSDVEGDARAWAAAMAVAKAEGDDIAFRRDAKKRLVITWTSLPVALAIIALIGRACFGGP